MAWPRWVTIFGLAHHLESLSVTGMNAQDLFKTLSSPSDASVDGPPRTEEVPTPTDSVQCQSEEAVSDGDPEQPYRTVLWKNLNYLTLEMIDFVDDVEELLLQVLQERADAGHGLECLIIEKCSGISDDTIERLEDVVEVNWDGKNEDDCCPGCGEYH